MWGRASMGAVVLIVLASVFACCQGKLLMRIGKNKKIP